MARSPVFFSSSAFLYFNSKSCLILAFSRLRTTCTITYKKNDNHVKERQPIIHTFPTGAVRYSGYEYPMVINSVTTVQTTRVPSLILADTSSLCIQKLDQAIRTAKKLGMYMRTNTQSKMMVTYSCISRHGDCSSKKTATQVMYLTKQNCQ